MTRHVAQSEDQSPLGEALRAAYLEVTTARAQGTATAEQAVVKGSSERAANEPSDDEIDRELAPSRADFIAAHLDGGRVMTPIEVMRAMKEKRNFEISTTAFSDEVPLVPRNLAMFWEIHQAIERNTPRPACVPIGKHQDRIHRVACDVMHSEACQVVERRRLQVLQGPAAPSVVPQPKQPIYHAPEVDTNTVTWKMVAAPPANARAPPNERPTDHHPIAPRVQTRSSAAALPIELQQQISSFDSPPRAPAPARLKPHASPTVRLAEAHEARMAQPSSDSTVIKINVDSGRLPPTAIIWKLGAEADGAGWNYSAYCAVKTSYEQVNSGGDKDKPYCSFKTFVDPRFISTVCSYTGIPRVTWDKESDSRIIRLIEEKLKPKDSTIFFLKMCSMFVTGDKSIPLYIRYRAFADPFVSNVNDADEAGLSLPEEAIKSAFKDAISCSNRLKMWTTELRWTNLAEVHLRITEKLRVSEAEALGASIDDHGSARAQRYNARAGGPAQPNVLPPAPQAPPILPAQVPIAAPLAVPAAPRQQFTPEQKREYSLQQFNIRQQRQADFNAQQQSVMANTIQASVDAAWQRFELSHAPAQSVQPLIHHALPPAPSPVASNAVQERAQPWTQPQAIPAVHPGLDERGPNWHICDSTLGCRYNPCRATLCQGCGAHGHSVADCRKRGHPEFNQSGYYSERMPGRPALPFYPREQAGYPPRSPMANLQPRVPPPGMPQPSIPPPPAFPTPHQMTPSSVHNSTAQSSSRYTPVVRSNSVGAQTAPQGGAAAPPKE